MRRRAERTVGDKVMIAVLFLATALALALMIFAVVEIARRDFDRGTGVRALVGLLLFGVICCRSLRKRWSGGFKPPA